MTFLTQGHIAAAFAWLAGTHCQKNKKKKKKRRKKRKILNKIVRV